jgi:hypothetical protein
VRHRTKHSAGLPAHRTHPLCSHSVP